MEKDTINELVEGVKLSRKKIGSYNEPAILERLNQITFKLSGISEQTKYYDDIQFLIFLANKQVENIYKLEDKADALIFDNLKTLFRIDAPHLKYPYERLNAVGVLA